MSLLPYPTTATATGLDKAGSKWCLQTQCHARGYSTMSQALLNPEARPILCLWYHQARRHSKPLFTSTGFHWSLSWWYQKLQCSKLLSYVKSWIILYFDVITEKYCDLYYYLQFTLHFLHNIHVCSASSSLVSVKQIDESRKCNCAFSGDIYWELPSFVIYQVFLFLSFSICC